MGTISSYSNIEVNLKEKVYLYINSTPYRYQKNNKTFLIEEFFHLPPVSTSTTPVVNLHLRILAQIVEKIRNGLSGYSGAWGKLFHEQA
jgi:hypothetical protein